MKRSAGALVTLLLLLGLVGTARSESTSGYVENGDRFGDALATGDFDGDGRADLAVGVAFEDAGAIDAGVVNVVYGSGPGLTPTGNQVWYQGTAGIGDGPEEEDWFGRALATGDFNGDDFDDIAIGVPKEQVGDAERAGAVNVIYGSDVGLTEVDDHVLTQDLAEDDDRFGRALAAGDFNGDGNDDLAVGAPGEKSDEPELVSNSGAVDVFNGSGDGLSATSSEQWHQGLSTVEDEPGPEDFFGSALAAGNLGAGSQDDLVIGVPGESFDEQYQGAVHVLYGSGGGLGSLTQFWHQDVPRIAGTTEFYDNFGASLAIGNFGRGSPGDLAIGVPNESVEADASDVSRAGIVHVLYGSSELGLTSEGDQVWHQSKPGIRDRIEPNDNFGFTLSAADFGNSTRADLAIGAHNEDLDAEFPAKSNAGVVHLLYGSVDGLTSAQDELWHQDVIGVKNSAESNDEFGNSLASGNFGSGGTADLAIGVPSESLKGIVNAGAANVLYGSADGLSKAGDQFWHQTVP